MTIRCLIQNPDVLGVLGSRPDLFCELVRTDVPKKRSEAGLESGRNDATAAGKKIRCRSGLVA